VHSFLGDVIKNMTEREEALGESTKFAARVGILQALRATGRDLLVAASSPVEIWVARIPAKWDKDNRTAWEALFLNRTCQDLCSDEGFHFPTKLE